MCVCVSVDARVTGTANSLITATKQHAAASGLSPVALLDAAASNLTSSVVELIKAVGIRPSPKAELQEWAAGLGKAPPAYEISTRSGPDHAPLFVVTVEVAGLASASGQGASRRAAEQAAAQALMVREGLKRRAGTL